MKLLFPFFASLMLQYQVNSEFLSLKKCFFGYGKCKNSCHQNEREIQDCKNKKCCIGPKVSRLIKTYLRNEIPHLPDNDVIEMLRTKTNSTFVIQRKHLLTAPSKTSSFPNINSGIVPKTSPVKPVTISTRTPRRVTHTPTKSYIKKRPASTLPQPPHGPP